MPYTIHNEARIRFPALTKAEETVWDKFVRNIHAGQDPKTAADGAGDTDYKKLAGTRNQWQFRLSGKNRVSFVLDGTTLRQVQVGGHT